MLEQLLQGWVELLPPSQRQVLRQSNLISAVVALMEVALETELLQEQLQMLVNCSMSLVTFASFHVSCFHVIDCDTSTD